MEQGLKPRWSDRRDRDFIKTHELGAVPPTQYVEFWMDKYPSQNQNAMGLPLGCTGMSQAKLCSNQDGIKYDPAYIYDNTPPHTRDRGRDMRQSLSFVCKNDLKEYLRDIVFGSKRSGYFSIRAQGILDWFDAIYVSLLSTFVENRCASIGVPWFKDWQATDKDGILKMPANLSPRFGYWHNAVIVGGKYIKGEYYLCIDSHQGTEYGDNGIVYMNKELCNAVFNINMTEVFTVSKTVKGQIQTIELSIIENVVSFILNLLKK